ncbi:cobalt-zinc-cadmium resistance protein CzcA [Phenylobacterium haematophilum]|uniref:Cobalt-zinc-cadmium resistance protein CzcA n=1 Tax=Phenylobacterium haematophilum TaxID=98513 RepID=A0A840A1T0_9CAUL|nr:CusA/CzcA family heavy metal efflux RND transporter [Phenylobacterium haematophilum]MBB3891471.1 cobalt-zinc-cadmium resistance protein CzcA [Phenylobacterium haematophilum]MBP6878329.1 CusA/CzcA family heavy metal efflux RND transporter [Phenylobacterium sp.]
MIGRILSMSVRGRWYVLFLTLIIAIYGGWQLTKLPIDAVPDITNKQVQINTVAGALSPVEIEKRVTFPVETALAGIPGLETTRSISRNGFSQVTAIFSESTDLYFARQQVAERLTQARDTLPASVQPQIGPVTTGLGEVFMYSVEFANPDGKGAKVRDGSPGWQSDGSYLTAEGERLTDSVARAAYLRTVQDWVIRPQLRSVKGVAGIDSIGGFEKQYVVEPDPSKLAAYGVSYTELAKALEASNLSVGANFIQRAGEAYLVRADARVRTLDEIQNAVIATRGTVPVAVKDVATVRVGGDLRTGAATKKGEEVVVGTALMLIGENSRSVAKAVGEKLDDVRKSLPPGVVVNTTLDRSVLVNATIATVERNLTEGAILVAATLFLLLGNVRAALIAVLIIPLSFLMMAIGMNKLNVPGNLMSLGALDFGLIVDGTVIIIENCLLRLAERQHREGRLLLLPERLETVLHASQEMIRPTVYGQAIIFLVFAPLLTFTGVEGKTFSPMAITIMLALGAAFILSLTFVPAMVAILMRGKVSEKEVRIIAYSKRHYDPVLKRAIARPWPFIGAGVALFLVAGGVYTTLGQEFIPQLDEKNLAMGSLKIPSTSLEQSKSMQQLVERAVTSLPEVEMMFSKTGTAEVATDPMPPNQSDGFIILKPQKEWPEGVKTKAQVVERIEAKVAPLLGNSYEVSQPIQMRFNELIAGVRGDVAIKLYGDDLDKMGLAAAKIGAALESIQGADGVRIEQTAGAPTLDVRFDRPAIARFGLTVEEVAETVAAALGGRQAGDVFEGDKRFDITVRVPMANRNDLEAIGALPVMLPSANGGMQRSVPLRELVQFRFADGLNQVSREDGKRRVVIQVNVRDRDIGSFVNEARTKVEAVALPPGSWITWGGQFENLKAATARLGLVVPICFIMIFVILYMALGGLAPAASVFAAIPLGLSGGVFALALTGITFSISAAVGFIVLAGVAVLNGLVVMSSIRQRLDEGMPVSEAIYEGAAERFRPVLMTGLVPAIGFIPMALATGTGAEVQKPLAMVVIGGLITATAVTLVVLPAISQLILRLGRRRADPAESPAALTPIAP